MWENEVLGLLVAILTLSVVCWLTSEVGFFLFLVWVMLMHMLQFGFFIVMV